MKSKHGTLMFFTLAIILTWTTPLAAAPEKVTEKKGEKTQTSQPAGQAAGRPKELSPTESYIFIAEKNLFHPDRKEFPVQLPPSAGAGAAEVKKPPARPQIVLCGITIANDYESASLSNPGRPLRKGERETQTFRKGESIGEYKLAKIFPDRIVLEAPEDSFEVLLYDPKVTKKRSDVKTENKPAAVIGLGPTPAAPAPAPGPKAPAAPVRPVPPQAQAEAPKEPAKVAETPVPKPVPPVTRPMPVPSARARAATRLPQSQQRVFQPGEAEEP